MNQSVTRQRQKGVVTIFVSMIMLIFITLIVVTAFSMSTMNLRAVGNVQSRTQSIAAAEKAIESIIDTKFWNPAIAQNFDIDVDHDLNNDVRVAVAEPVCVRAIPASITASSSVLLPGFSAPAAWNTLWEIDATASDVSSGTKVRVRQGVRVLLSETDRNLYCPG